MKKVSVGFRSKKKSVKDEVQELKLRIDAEKRMKQDDIPAPRQPKSSTLHDFPEDVSEIPHVELGQYLGQYESEAAWITYSLARKEIDYDNAQLLLDYVYGKLLSDAEGKASEQKAKVNGNDYYLQCKLEVQEIMADIKLLRASLDTYERYARTISREITNRKNFMDSFPGGRI